MNLMKKETNKPARSFFNVLHQSALESLGIIIDENNLEKAKSDIDAAFNRINSEVKHFCALCKTSEGLLHLHEVATYPKAIRVNKVIREYNCGAHIEVMAGKKQDAINYILKRGKWQDSTESILLVWGDSDSVKNNQGTRGDLHNFDIIALKQDFDLLKYFVENGISGRTESNLTRRFQNLMMGMHKNTQRKVVVIYIEGEKGSGKTRRAIDTAKKIGLSWTKISVDSKNNFPLNGYLGEKCLILDELREDTLNFEYLMQILEGYYMPVNIKGGIMPAMWELVIISSAEKLDDWYRYQSSNQDNRREQLFRRINAHFYAENNKWYDYSQKEVTLFDIEDIIEKTRSKYSDMNIWDEENKTDSVTKCNIV